MSFHKIIRILEDPRRADKSAPTGVRMNLFMFIIGGVRDKSAPTGVRMNL